MADDILFNGTTYSVPDTDDTDWGDYTNETIKGLLNGAVAKNQIIDDVTTGGSTDVLSAEQGKDLNTAVVGKLAKADLDDTPADDADTAVTSKYFNDSMNTAFKVKKIVTKTDDYAITDSDAEMFVMGDVDANKRFTLPAVANSTNREITIYNDNKFSCKGDTPNNKKVDVVTQSGELLNGVARDGVISGAFEILAQYCGIRIRCDGTQWFVTDAIGQCTFDFQLGTESRLLYKTDSSGTAGSSIVVTAHNSVINILDVQVKFNDGSFNSIYRDVGKTWTAKASLGTITIANIPAAYQGQSYNLSYWWSQ